MCSWVLNFQLFVKHWQCRVSMQVCPYPLTVCGSFTYSLLLDFSVPLTLHLHLPGKCLLDF